MHRDCRWSTEEGEGLEHFTLTRSDEGVLAEGVVIGPAFGPMYTGELFGCSYAVQCDARWRVRRVEVKVAGGANLVLQGDGEGRWRGPDGAPLAALDGCIDVDLTCTPFTNTLPIRRLGDALQARHEITVAYITLPEASVQPSRQACTRIGASRYRFDSLSNPFQAAIDTDADGLVLHYPGLFRRVAG